MTGSRRSIAFATALSIALGGLGCSGAPPHEEELAQLRSERRILLNRFSSVQQAIRAAQNQALKEPGVQHAQAEFNETFRRVVQRDDPESVELLDRARAVGQDVQRMATPIILPEGEEDPRPSTPEERAGVADELKEVETRLRPVVQRAFQDPAVAEAFAVLRDSVVASILRSDPGAQRSIDLMEEIESRVAEIDAEIARLSQ